MKLFECIAHFVKIPKWNTDTPPTVTIVQSEVVQKARDISLIKQRISKFGYLFCSLKTFDEPVIEVQV